MGSPLKAAGSLLVTISLVLGTYAASTAYLAPIGSIDPEASPTTLHAPAGRSDSLPPQPLLRPGPRTAPLTLEASHLEMLREAGVDRVHVKEFSLARWREAWLFGLSVTGLLAGSLMVRSAIRRAAASAAAVARGGAGRPESLLDAALARSREVRDQLQGAPASAGALARILGCVESLQAECFDPFVERRRELVAELGMGGYAQLMDRFAAAERQFNRAWSAAADTVAAEAAECFGRGILLLEEARSRLGVRA
jgi:hypothetical protein